MKLYIPAVMLIWIAVAVGCSGNGTIPVQPADNPLSIAKSDSIDTSHVLWGMWDIGIDLETMTATVMPDRDAENHFNVLPFLMPPKCYDCLKLHMNSFDDVTRILDIDVTLRNKFSVSGYDVRGILFTDDLGHLLINEDAWTGLYDIPGGDAINPFKAFAKDDPERKYQALGQLTENYRIWVPDPPKYILIKYAVDASYPTNCAEPYAIGNFTQGDITNEIGSHGTVSVAVNDWQGDVDSVSVDAPDLNDSTLALTHQTGDTWSGDLANIKGAMAGDYTVKVTATSAGSGTTSLIYFAILTIGEAPSLGGWARTWGGSDYDVGNDVAVDGSGNSYVTGIFSGTVDFNPGSIVENHTSNGGHDIFLSKYDSCGNFIWAETWGGTKDDYGYSIAMDGSGFVYLTGRFSGKDVDFDPDPIAVDLHSSNGSQGADDIYLSEFDSSGALVRAMTWGGPLHDEGRAVAVDGSGNVYMTGLYAGTVDMDPGVGVDNHAPNGGLGIFFSKFDSSGAFVWAKTWGGTEMDYAYGVVPDGPTDVYVAGFFSGTSDDFNPDPVAENLHTSNGKLDVFLSKFDSSGNFAWARTWGGVENDRCYGGVAVDGLGSVYVTGEFRDYDVDFNPDPVGEDLHSTKGVDDVFLSKFDSSGTFVWARTWGWLGTDYGNDIEVDGSGNVYLTGTFNGTADFNPDPVAEDPHTANGSFDIFLSKFDSSGTFVWARTWGGGEDSDNEAGSGIDLDGSGNIYVSGYFQGTMVDFNPDPIGINYHSSKGDIDIFLSKFLPDGSW